MSSEWAGWMAGAATRGFAVAAGTLMVGYAARIGPATGTCDELQIGAIFLSHSDQRFVIVAADVAAVDTALVDEIAALAGIDRAELVVCASHTHSGPAGIVPNMHPSEPDRTDPVLRASFAATCVLAIKGALERLEPVELFFGSNDTAGLAANRNRENGAFDRRVSVLATRTLSGDLHSVLVHFACHPTILGANNRLISADFPGALRRSLSASLEAAGHKPAILFANGAAGDVSTRYTRQGQSIDEVERVGAGLAAAAGLALNTAGRVSGPIRYARKHVRVSPRSLDRPRGPMPASNDGRDKELTAAERRREETRMQGASLLRRLTEVGPEHIQSSLDIEAWALGDLAIVSIPGELFASLGARITGASPSPTIVLGYANGYVGYLADDDAYANGTYEALASPFAAGTGEYVGKVARDLAEQLRREFGGEPDGM